MNVAVEASHRVQWLTPAPLWPSIVGADEPGPAEVRAMQRPEILRFASDSFMNDLAVLLERDPEKLAGKVARPESHREPAPGKPSGYRPALDHLKLFHPLHGDFNLVAATLACRVPGLPDKGVETAAGEKVGFVLRRMSGNSELGWVPDPDTVTAMHWAEVEDPDALGPGEEVLPMFPVRFPAGERQRRLFVGLIPTASRASARKVATPAVGMDPEDRQTEPTDPRADRLQAAVIDQLAAIRKPMAGGLPPGEDPAKVARSMREMKEEASRFVLLDFAELLQAELPTVWSALRAGQPPAGTDPAALYNLLNGASADTSRWQHSWRTALTTAWAQSDLIAGEAEGTPTLVVNLEHTNIDPVALKTAFGRALPTAQAGPGTAATGEAPFDAPKVDPRRDVRYRLRCVYERPACGPLHPPLVSRRSRSFAIASFFDFDAPGRSIQITMPIDTSLADLRKYRKNVSLLISDQLRQQMTRVTDLNQALKGNIAAGEPLDIGVICSFSLPIITICALIVLMIMISLLNIVFWWMPFFRICFPIGLKSKA